jgi:hypothetical protein
MFITNNVPSDGLGESASIRSRRATGLTIWTFVGLLLWLLSAPLADAATLLPLDKPLRFGTDKVVELSVELARNRAYHLDIAFPFHGAQQRAYIRNVVGDATRICKLSNECGVPTVFLVTIKIGEAIILK